MNILRAQSAFGTLLDSRRCSLSPRPWAFLLGLAAGCSDAEVGASAGRGTYVGTVGLTLPGDVQSSYTALLPSLDEAADASLRGGYESEGFTMPSTYDGFIFVPGGPNFVPSFSVTGTLNVSSTLNRLR